MACPSRTYPLRQPKNHKPPIPRWQLVLGQGVDRVFTAYVGIQLHSQCGTGTKAAEELTTAIQKWLSEDEDHPLANEYFNHLEGDDAPGATIWVFYWDDEVKGKRSLERLGIASIHSRLSPDHRTRVGLWSESFLTPVSRLETNYSGLDYLPGLAKLPNTDTVEHKLSAYWGAARDRIPDSAHDLFEKDDAAQTTRPKTIPNGLGQRLVGTNYDNMVHIRSGQF